MKAIYKFTDKEKTQLEHVLKEVAKISPYTEYNRFSEKLQEVINENFIPEFMYKLCTEIKVERTNGKRIHLLKNCPIDGELPNLSFNDPVNEKYKMKKSFCSEAFMALFANLLDAPLFSYESRNNGDFFTDVLKINRMQGKNSGFTDGDLIYHNDRTSHPIKADYITLLGMICPENERTYTNYIDGKDIISRLPDEDITILSKKIFYTEVDDLTKEANGSWLESKPHEIISGDKIFFQETLTKPIDTMNLEAYKSILNLKDAITASFKNRVRLCQGDLLVFPNQYGLHNREKIEINADGSASKRWLLKTYSFENSKVSEKYQKYKVAGSNNSFKDKA